MVCPINPVAFNIFGKDIYWYGIIMASAMLLAIIVTYFNMRKRKLPSDWVFDLAVIVIPLAIVCARLYYVLFELDYYLTQPWWKVFAVWEGGLAIYGGVIGGVIGALIFSRWKRVHFAKILDIAAPALILGQAIGRWGNFVNQEAYGMEITNTALQKFPFAVFIEASGRYHAATFLYESSWNLLVFAVLMLFFYEVIFKKAKRYNGDVVALYFLLYGVGRFFIEGMRTDSLWLGSIRISQLLSAVFVVGAVLYFVFRKRLTTGIDADYVSKASRSVRAGAKCDAKECECCAKHEGDGEPSDAEPCESAQCDTEQCDTDNDKQDETVCAEETTSDEDVKACDADCDTCADTQGKEVKSDEQ